MRRAVEAPCTLPGSLDLTVCVMAGRGGSQPSLGLLFQEKGNRYSSSS